MLEAAVVIDLVLGRYAEAGVISLDQSQLTSESLPVEARAGAASFTGSQVVRGEASGIVTATAGRTQFGKTAQLVQLARAPKRLQLLTVSIAKYLLALDVVLIAIVIVAAVIKGTTLSNTLPCALVLLVASAPASTARSSGSWVAYSEAEKRGLLDGHAPERLSFVRPTRSPSARRPTSASTATPSTS